MITRRGALGGVLGVIVGSAAISAARAEQSTSRNVTFTIKGGFGVQFRKDGTWLKIRSPKKPSSTCSYEWHDHPLLLVGHSSNAKVKLPLPANVDSGGPGLDGVGWWWVKLNGGCTITQGMPNTGLTNPQFPVAKLEAPYTPVPYDSKNGWNHAAWGLPLGTAPADINDRAASTFTFEGGVVSVLPPNNEFAKNGRWKVAKWEGQTTQAKHVRALTDIMTLVYTQTFATLKIKTDDGEIEVVPQQTDLNLQLCREFEPAHICYKDDQQLDHVRMIYSLAAIDRCESFDVPKYDVVNGRPTPQCFGRTPGDLCPFGFFDPS